MTLLPDDLAQECAHLFAVQRPAWLRVSADGRIAEAGGELAAYGLQGAEPGAIATRAAPFLEGLLPLGLDAVALPVLQLGGAVFADVHLFPDHPGAWVLILQSHEDAAARVRTQQAVNELFLDLERGEPSPLPELIRDLQLLLLERVAAGRFRRLGAAPEWARDAVTSDGEFDPGGDLLFLQSFLVEAEEFWRRHDAGGLRSGPWTERARGGQFLYLQATAVALAQGNRLLLIEPANDLDERRGIVQQAREQTLEQEQLRREIEKKEILAHCIVHDLRGPLAGILGALEMLQEGLGPDHPERESADLALESADKLRRMIAEVLETFVAEQPAGRRVDAPGIHDVERVARRVAAQMRPGYQRCGVRLAVRAPEEAAGLAVPGRADRLERVLANLLENAMRFATKGSTVWLSLARQDACVVIHVDNDGPPVPEDVRERLFERFSSSGTPGHGLGLYYCRITVESWGGTIRYEPRHGGARFVVSLPATNP